MVNFSEDSHRLKAKMLLKSLAKFTYQTCGQPDAINTVTLLVAVANVSGKPFQFKMIPRLQQTL